MTYRHVTDAALPHFRAATWWAWSSWMNITCITSQNAALQLWWPWVAVWLLAWQCWHRRWLVVTLRLNGIFLTFTIPLCLACYSPAGNVYWVSNNSCISAHLLCYRCQLSRQPDKCNRHNKIESRPEHYSPVQELMQQQAATWSKNKKRHWNKD